MIWERHLMDRLPSPHCTADVVIIVKAARYTKVVLHV